VAPVIQTLRTDCFFGLFGPSYTDFAP
jgi:hypothetical protein